MDGLDVGDQPADDRPLPVIQAVTIDCADPLVLGRFWQQLLGGELHQDRYGDTQLHGAGVRLDFRRVPDVRLTKNRLHLDLSVPPEHRQQTIDRAVALGATTADDLYDGGRWQVMRDVEENEFCFVWGTVRDTSSLIL
jgi:hypothetical protein